MRRDVEWPADMLESIEAIGRHTQGGDGEFRQNELVQTWVVHHLQVIGEAAARVSPLTRAQNPEVPWTRIADMRNVLVHEYFGIDLEIVWDTVISDLPLLRVAVETMLARIGDD